MITEQTTAEPIAVEPITTHPATADRWDDLQTVLAGGGDGRSCQCAWPVMTAGQWRSTTVDQRRKALHDEVDDEPAPGIIVYVGEDAAGWMRVGPRMVQRRVLNSRVMKSGTKEPLEADDVWAITCASIRTKYRRRGLEAVLVDAAVRYARERGARVIEAYPIDNTVARPSGNSMFVGALTTFLHAGFTVISHPTPTRAVVSLEVGR